MDDLVCGVVPGVAPDRGADSTIPAAAEVRDYEKELENSRANFKAFFNTSMDLLMVLDKGGAIIAVNQRTCPWLGYAEAELIGRSVLEVHPPELRGETSAIVGAMLAGTAEKCPIPLLTREGQSIPVETRIVHGVWDGKPALLGIAGDMSELVESVEKFRRAFNSTETVMAISSVDDGLGLGTVAYIYKPFNPEIVKTRLRIHLKRLVKTRTLELEEARQAAIAACLAEFRDTETGTHITRTREYMRCLAGELAGSEGPFDFESVDLLSESATLHDIGKVGIPDSILLKPSALTPAEFMVI